MEARTVRGLELDGCPACHGRWFDPLELARLARTALPPVTAVGPSKRQCPSCRSALEARRMGPVVVDGCASCHGVFLDHGEFERLRRGRAPVRERGWSQRSKPVEERTGIDVSNLDGVLYELFG